MDPRTDPYRTLGLPAGAPLDEVKRAYRKLAKANHPDTAGSSAIPRFLAIQAAYEVLAGGVPGPAVARATSRSDPAQTRATRNSWQRRAGEAPGGNAGSAETGARPGPRRRRPPGRARTGAGEQRPPDRATPGSTSYDFAEHEPFDPEWSGGAWYGPSSGTYWTINPKEYADPRKHGPEYQARARRGSPGDQPVDGSDVDPARSKPAAGEPPPSGGSNPEPAVPEAGPLRAAPAHRAAPRDRPRAAPSAGQHGAPPAWSDAAGSGAGDAGPGGLPRLGTLRPRVTLALVGWPPIGIALALVIGEATGCGRFAATCVDSFAFGTWIGQLAVIVVLLIVPGLAAISAAGTVATLAAAAPVAVVLSATGGSRDPGTAGIVLGLFLVLAWLGGVAFALVRRSRTVPP